MLVLTRKCHEGIQIGENIEIKVLAIEGEQIKIGIDAPEDVDIHRKEVYETIQKQNNEALQLSANLIHSLKNNNV
ncbi:MAG TPA: carbon storage regulator CsrA [Bacillota bacterium]|nr:carbon storage regulator CsrA [Bacillota bacterium]